MSARIRGAMTAILAIAMMISILAVPVMGVDGKSNLALSADKSTVGIGEPVTVTLSIKGTTAESISGDFAFDRDSFECVKVEGGDPDYPGDFTLTKTNGGRSAYVELTVHSLPSEVNQSGTPPEWNGLLQTGS